MDHQPKNTHNSNENFLNVTTYSGSVMAYDVNVGNATINELETLSDFVGLDHFWECLCK